MSIQYMVPGFEPTTSQTLFGSGKKIVHEWIVTQSVCKLYFGIFDNYDRVKEWQ